jgi:transposase
MGRYVEGQDRTQSALFPERLDDWIHEDRTVRVIDVFVDELDLSNLGFERAEPAATTARRFATSARSSYCCAAG